MIVKSLVECKVLVRLMSQASLNSKQSFINGVNKPFMGLFLLSWYLYDTCFDSTLDIIVWEIIKRICYDNNISLGYTHNIICMSMHTNIFDVTNDVQLDLKQIYFYTILNLMRPRCQSLMRIMMILHWLCIIWIMPLIMQHR